MSTNPICMAIAGAERSGKSFFVWNWAKKRGRPYIVYNCGDDGFDDATEIEFLTAAQAAEEKGLTGKALRNYLWSAKDCDFFRVDGKMYPIAQLNQVAHKYKALRQFGTIGGKGDSAFFDAMYLYGAGLLLILDDARPLFRNGLNSSHIKLFSRKSHTGAKATWKPTRRGVEIVTIFHNIDRINSELFDYMTHCALFYSTQPPRDNIDNPDAFRAIAQAYDELKTAPKYSARIVPLKGENAFQIIKIHPNGAK